MLSTLLVPLCSIPPQVSQTPTFPTSPKASPPPTYTSSTKIHPSTVSPPINITSLPNICESLIPSPPSPTSSCSTPSISHVHPRCIGPTDVPSTSLTYVLSPPPPLVPEPRNPHLHPSNPAQLVHRPFTPHEHNEFLLQHYNSYPVPSLILIDPLSSHPHLHHNPPIPSPPLTQSPPNQLSCSNPSPAQDNTAKFSTSSTIPSFLLQKRRLPTPSSIHPHKYPKCNLTQRTITTFLVRIDTSPSEPLFSTAPSSVQQRQTAPH